MPDLVKKWKTVLNYDSLLSKDVHEKYAQLLENCENYCIKNSTVPGFCRYIIIKTRLEGELDLYSEYKKYIEYGKPVLEIQ